MSSVENNKRIAKNTCLLYFRMFLTMAVSLFTSRIVLQTLGVEDYGINNVVGGVVVLFTFLNNTMASATQRFLSFELGQGDNVRLNQTFNVAMQVHLLIVVCIILLAETVGLWFTLNYLVIPVERLGAALWVYQCAILGLVVSITQVPYTASIISHEDMGVFAYLSFFDVLLKLLVVYLLYFIDYDKLKLIAILHMASTVLVAFIYRIYCIKHYKETNLHLLRYYPKIFKSMLSYLGWNLSNHIALIARTQGVNILINMFFGPSMNAARAVSVQVNTAITSFVNNFRQAMNPQIVKQYAAGDIDSMNVLLLKGAKYSFFLLCILSFPAIITMDYLLLLWLKNVPDYSLIFCRIALISALIDTVSSPIGYGALATGKVKRYQLTMSVIFLLVPLLTYLSYKMGCDAIFCLFAEIFSYCLALFFRPYLLSKVMDFSLKKYYKMVIIPCFLVVLFSIPMAYVIINYVDLDDFLSFILVVIASVVYITITILLVGLDRIEKLWLLNKIKIKFKIFAN